MQQGVLNAEAETEALAVAVGSAVAASEAAIVMALKGNLGAGKSFFARALLTSHGVEGPVRSPTYTLIEPYECSLGTVLHLDLYRLADPEEMFFLGIEDLQQNAKLTMIEWPEKAGGFWSEFDLNLTLSVTADGRNWQLQAHTEAGQKVMQKLTVLLN